MTAGAMAIREEVVSWAPTEQDAIVVLDLRTSRYLSLNTSGSLLWLKLVDGATYDNLRSALVARFGVDQAAAGTDVDGFLEALRIRDLLIES